MVAGPTPGTGWGSFRCRVGMLVVGRHTPGFHCGSLSRNVFLNTFTVRVPVPGWLLARGEPLGRIGTYVIRRFEGEV